MAISWLSATGAQEFEQLPALMRPDQRLLDLVRMSTLAERLGDRYDGVNW